jgi:hypothetical protein
LCRYDADLAQLAKPKVKSAFDAEVGTPYNLNPVDP